MSDVLPHQILTSLVPICGKAMVTVVRAASKESIIWLHQALGEIQGLQAECKYSVSPQGLQANCNTLSSP